ncbi:hypothetical protein K466DRAFT_571250, partial [Polyporus arcularius HHB13444]
MTHRGKRAKFGGNPRSYGSITHWKAFKRRQEGLVLQDRVREVSGKSEESKRKGKPGNMAESSIHDSIFPLAVSIMPLSPNDVKDCYETLDSVLPLPIERVDVSSDIDNNLMLQTACRGILPPGTILSTADLAVAELLGLEDSTGVSFLEEYLATMAMTRTLIGLPPSSLEDFEEVFPIPHSNLSLRVYAGGLGVESSQYHIDLADETGMQHLPEGWYIYVQVDPMVQSVGSEVVSFAEMLGLETSSPQNYRIQEGAKVTLVRPGFEDMVLHIPYRKGSLAHAHFLEQHPTG